MQDNIAQAVDASTCEPGIKVTMYDMSGLTNNNTRDPVYANFKQIGVEYVDSVNIPSTSAGFLTSGKTNWIGATYEGYVMIPEAGEWTFGTYSDDGSYIYIDDQMVVDNHGGHGMRERKGTISLEKGMHKFYGTWEQGSGPYGIQFLYGGPGTSYGLIPATRFKQNC
jgi:hypothetical protein